LHKQAGRSPPFRFQMPRFCALFKPPSPAQQLAAIGLGCSSKPGAALCRCLDPSGGDWEDIDAPQEDEWLDQMLSRTPNQSFQDFISSRPNVPDHTRHTIYLQPLCDPQDLEAAPFPEGPWPSWTTLETVVQRFYHPLTVRTLPAVPMDRLIPKPASRINHFGMQYNAHQVLDALHRGSVPRDAFCTLAVTMCDLYPKPEWNFVYGLARLSGRVGVFSFVRHTPSPQALMLHRSLKTVLHEIGHMFGMKHCTWFNCLMRGSNGEEVEHQKNYLHLCPVCLRKLHSSLGFDVPAQYTSLLEIFQEFEAAGEGFQRDCEFLRSRLDALKDLPAGASAGPQVKRAGSAPETAGRPRRRQATGSPSPRQVDTRQGRLPAQEFIGPQVKRTGSAPRQQATGPSRRQAARKVSLVRLGAALGSKASGMPQDLAEMDGQRLG